MNKFLYSTLTASTLLAGPASAKELLVNCLWPAQHFFCADVLAPWAVDVAAATEGRVTVTVPSRSLAPPPKQIESIRGGLFDAGFTFNGFLADEITGPLVAMMPFTGTGDGRASSIALWRTYETHLSGIDEYDGLHLLSAFVAPGGDFYSLNETPIETLADATNRKMWALPGVTSAILSAGGGSVVSGPAIQMAEVIQSGVVDGFVGIPPWDADKFNALQHAKSITVTKRKIFTPAFSFVISDAAWDEISQADQTAIMALSGAAFAETVGTIWTGLNDKKMQSLDAQMQVIPASDALEAELLAASNGPLQGWLKRMQAIGLDGQEILDFYTAQIAAETPTN
ncbi:hypothetical protein AB0T83_07540 [Fluviibacterium sp. DFM31]|uniref:Uncharacterized protein n=1 Tax=Meridianimarinicoccus marinus TaxID=3231483 RepID=A0ABV3L533_9RHOB